MKQVIKIRITLWSILGLVVLWLIWQGIVPGGQITYSQDFSSDSFFIRKLGPVDRVASGENEFSKYLIGDPVYFSLVTPRRFDEARVSVWLRNKSELPVVEAGVLVDKTVWRHALAPLSNHTIDQLSLVWSRVEDDGVVLLQKEKKYADIEAFLSQPPPHEQIAVYNYELELEYIIDDYAASDEEYSFAYPLRGPYQFYTYIKDEELDFVFNLLDLNQNKDPDNIDIHVYYQGELITTRHLDDDGITTDNGEASKEIVASVKLGGMPEGVYKIEVRANNDIVTKGITAAQSKLSFIGRLELLNDSIENIELITDSKKIQATSIHPESTQIIKAGESEINLSKTYEQYEADAIRESASSTFARLLLERDGVIISGDGVLAISEEALINPRIKKVDRNLDIALDGVSYVLARYNIVEPTEGWQESVATLDLRPAYRERGAYSFIFSIPGLRADDDVTDFIEVDSIFIELTGKSLGAKLKELFERL